VKAGGIAKIIRGLKNTEAMGIDNIPTSVIKKGVEVLSGPISHLVNRSLAEGRVPEAFKVGKVFPVFKGKGKQPEDPSSYRPVSILPALSKVLETSVKAALERHLAKVNGLPNTQHGFRPRRSCTTALAHVQAGWLTGAERGQVVCIMAFNLSAAFDTVAAEQLLLKLKLLGVSGRALAWFKSYLTGGTQQVSWDRTLSNLIRVRYGVRQGSILGPVLFLILIGDMDKFLQIGNNENVVCVDDTTINCYSQGTPDLADLKGEKTKRATDATNQAGEVANPATDATDQAREAANLAREVSTQAT
jgi:hypothetical protein